MMHQLKVNLATHTYPIFIGADLLTTEKLLNGYIKGDKVAIVTNKTIAPLYLDKLLMQLKNFNVTTIIIDDGEQVKTLKTLNVIISQLLKKQLDRNSTLIALGGGVVGDITGFAAACYQRGIPFIQVPTTLLAQVDSSVGGKTGVNHRLAKNMIGAFYQPKCVLIDTETLKTLPDREFSAGMAEVIKYGLLMDADFFSYLERHITPIMAKQSKYLIEIILRSCKNKADIVSQDEKENNKRALLNLGHTFGHAIEKTAGYGHYLHGEAVAIGLMMAAELSHRQQRLSKNDILRIRELLTKANLPTALNIKLKKKAFIEAMRLDKKNVSGQIRLVLFKSLGQTFLSSDYDAILLDSVIDDFLK